MRKISVLLLLASLLIFIFPINVSGQSTEPSFDFTCQPYLQNLSQNGITISWSVNKYSTSYVQYGENSNTDHKAFHAVSGMIDAGSGVQKVILSNLKPGTVYFYKVISKEIKTHQAYKVVYGDSLKSKVYSFTTPSKLTESFSFMAFNDLHSKPQFTGDIVKREKGFSFVMLNGDILNDLNKESDIIDCMLGPFSTSFASEIPFYFTRGNHETRGIAARSLSKYIDTPNGEYFYSFNYGNTHFVVLDCGEDKPDDNQYYFGLADYDNYRSQEAVWLAKEVKTPDYINAKFRVVCIHMPVYLNSEGSDAEGYGIKDCSQKFAALLNDAGADILLCGHTHKYSMIKPKKGVNNFPIVMGGAPVGANNNLDKSTYTIVEVNKNILTATLKKANGDIIDKVELKSKKNNRQTQ